MYLLWMQVNAALLLNFPKGSIVMIFSSLQMTTRRSPFTIVATLTQEDMVAVLDGHS